MASGSRTWKKSLDRKVCSMFEGRLRAKDWPRYAYESPKWEATCSRERRPSFLSMFVT